MSRSNLLLYYLTLEILLVVEEKVNLRRKVANRSRLPIAYEDGRLERALATVGRLVGYIKKTPRASDV